MNGARSMRPRFATGVLSACLAAGAVWLLARGGAHRRPSVLLVTIDTLRADRLGCYGHQGARTPNLDALARRGVRFETAVAHAPITATSHASILTGLTPPRHGVRDNGAYALPVSLPTLAEAFSSAGYRTGAFVSGSPSTAASGSHEVFRATTTSCPTAMIRDERRTSSGPPIGPRTRPCGGSAPAATRRSSPGSTTSIPTRPTRRPRDRLRTASLPTAARSPSSTRRSAGSSNC